jgi:hypothetical protein
MNEEPIYGSTGWPIGWLVGNIVYDWSGQARAFMEGGSVFSYEAEYLGECFDGYFRDHPGDAVAFIDGAHGGPPLPGRKQPSPTRPELQEPPSQPPISSLPSPALGTLRWSENSWISFLYGWRPYRIADKYK